MPASLRTVLTTLLAALFTAGGVKFQITSKDYTDNILSAASFLAGAIVSVIEWWASQKERKKIAQIEAIIPGITKLPKDAEVKGVISINDPKTSEAPKEIVIDNTPKPN